MLKLISRPRMEGPAGGWMVQVMVPLVGTREPAQRLFVVGAPEKNAAEGLMRKTLGNLHCTIMARVKLTSRALASFELAEGGVQEIDAN